MEVWSVWLCLMMGALRTTEVEVPDPCLKEGRGQIHWQRKLELETGKLSTGKGKVCQGQMILPLLVLMFWGSVHEGMLSVPWMWHCHGKPVSLAGVTVYCSSCSATDIHVSWALSPAHTWECTINVKATKTRTNTPGHPSSKLSNSTPNSSWIAYHNHQLLCLYFTVFSSHTSTNLALLL